MDITENKRDVADVFGQLFQSQDSGDEGLLKIASAYSLQIPGDQLKGILLLKTCALYLDQEIPDKTIPGWVAQSWLELKQYNQSAPFIMRALDSIALRKFIGENSTKINVEK